MMSPLAPELFSLHGQVFVVTGASSGLGRAMAGFLCEAGATVIGIARREAALAEVKTECADQAGEFIAQPADLGELSGIEALGNACIKLAGKVDGLINAAGVNLRQPVEAVSPESWEQTLQLNLGTPFFLARTLVADMKTRNHGKIINIASLQSQRAFKNGLAYGASKGGICQLTRAMAEAWSADGIGCNAIAPGFFPTELTAPVFADPETEKWAASQTAIGRNGKLDDLRGPTLFFASRASDYVTGQTLYVDGGFTAK